MQEMCMWISLWETFRDKMQRREFILPSNKRVKAQLSVRTCSWLHRIHRPCSFLPKKSRRKNPLPIIILTYENCIATLISTQTDTHTQHREGSMEWKIHWKAAYMCILVLHTAHCTMHIDVIITLISALAILNRHKNSDELFDTRARLIKIPRSSHFPTKLTLDS